MAKYDWVFNNVVSDSTVLPIVDLNSNFVGGNSTECKIEELYSHQNHIYLLLLSEQGHLCSSVGWEKAGFRIQIFPESQARMLYCFGVVKTQYQAAEKM